MGRKKQGVSIYRIAEEAGVSAATVSRAMNRRAGVIDEVRAKIDELVRRYNFRANYPAARSARIALLVPAPEFSAYHAMAIQGMISYTSSHGLGANIIVGGGNANESALDLVRDQQCNGVVAMLMEPSNEDSRLLANSELPTVFLDTRISGPRAGFIDNDSLSGAKEAMRHLVGLGHRCIGYIEHANLEASNQRARLQGYTEVLEESGIEFNSSWVIVNQAGDDGFETTKELLRSAPELTAIMTNHDVLAQGAMAAIHSLGLRIPEDISIVGFDRLPGTERWTPPLTTVYHQISEAARLAAQALDNCFASPGTWTPPQIILPTNLVVRASSGPARAATLPKRRLC